VIQPHGPRLLVKRLDEAKVESTLIIVPETADVKASQYALVLAIGKLQQGGVKPGDVVILKDYAGAPVFVKLDGPDGPLSECALVMEDDCLAVVEGVGL
jgi:co-chaperonin GroES (HSP10)